MAVLLDIPNIKTGTNKTPTWAHMSFTSGGVQLNARTAYVDGGTIRDQLTYNMYNALPLPKGEKTSYRYVKDASRPASNRSLLYKSSGRVPRPNAQLSLQEVALHLCTRLVVSIRAPVVRRVTRRASPLLQALPLWPEMRAMPRPRLPPLRTKLK